MMARRAFPRDISESPSIEELRKYLGDLLDYLSRKRRLDLMAAGFTEPNLFELRQVAHAYRTDTLTPEIMSRANALFARLESVSVRAFPV